MNELRTEAICRVAADLRRVCGDLLGEPIKSEGERAAIFALQARTMDSLALVDRAENADQLLRLERDHLRPLALAVGRYARRHYLQVVRCPWPPVEPDPNACAIIAGAGRAELVQAAAAVGLRCIEPQPGRPAHENLWHQIAGAATTVVDVRLAEREERWPRICYALGLALAIGRTPFVVTDCPRDLPFDIYIEPFERTDGDQAALAIALAGAACRVSTGVRSPATVSAAASFAVRATPPADAWDRRAAERLRERAAEFVIDPLAVCRTVETYFGRPGAAFRAELSTFLPVYPEPDKPLCFHVLPFALPDWVSDAVQKGCRPRLTYERGDTRPTLEIVDRIWAGIGRASLIVVDLTGMNPNVCLELAVAQVLGRRLLLLHPAEGWSRSLLFPEIAALSVDTFHEPGNLTETVRNAAASL